jgi:hypothetical protein
MSLPEPIPFDTLLTPPLIREAAKVRWVVLTTFYLLYRYVLGVENWTALWILTTIAHNFLGFSNFGPTSRCWGEPVSYSLRRQCRLPKQPLFEKMLTPPLTKRMDAWVLDALRS